MRMSLLLRPYLQHEPADGGGAPAQPAAAASGATVTFFPSEPARASNVSVSLVREPANAAELLGGANASSQLLAPHRTRPLPFLCRLCLSSLLPC